MGLEIEMGCRDTGGVQGGIQGPVASCWGRGARVQERGTGVIVEVQGGLIQGMGWERRKQGVTKGTEG